MRVNKHILVLIGITFLLYFFSLFNSFVWDDEEQIVNNVQITAPNFVEHAFKGAIFNNGGSAFINNYYRPLMITTFGINIRLWGSNPFGFHLFQVFLHLLNVGLLYSLLKRLYTSGKMAFLPALIFAVHPLNVEPVVYIAATADPLSLTFILGTLLAILQSRKMTFFIPLIVFGLLAKESGILVIPAGLILCFWQRKTVFKRFLLASLIALAFYLLLRLGISGTGFGAGGIFPMQNAALSIRLLTIPKELFYYLSNFIYPHNLTIGQHWLILSPTVLDFWIPLAFNALFLTIAIFKGNKFFFLLFAFSFLLISNIFPLDNTVAPRWFYFPIVGIVGMLAPLFLKYQKLVYFYAAILFVLSLRRSLEWRSPLLLYSQDTVQNPQSFDLQNNFGTELYRIGNYNEAKLHFQKSVELNPKWWTNWNNLCAVAETENEYELAKKYCEQSIANGTYYLAYENLAKLLYFRIDKKAGWEFANKALNVLPNDLILQQIAGLPDH